VIEPRRRQGVSRGRLKSHADLPAGKRLRVRE